MGSFWQRLPRFRRSFVPSRLGLETVEGCIVPALVAPPELPINATLLGTQTAISPQSVGVRADGQFVTVW